MNDENPDSTEATNADTEGAPEDAIDRLVAGVLDGEHRALARAISKIENRASGYRRLVSALYPHAGTAAIVGVTGSPGAGKSTLVDKLAKHYRDRGETVGVIAIDPSSPYTGGSVLGDRIRMASTVGDMDVFVRSMSARGTLGGLSTATTDAITAMDAFGKDRIIVETVGAGQNEIDVVRAAETVCVLVPPDSGDAVQTLKAGILEIADVFVVNKADRPGADRTVQELAKMIDLGEGSAIGSGGHHGVQSAGSGVDSAEGRARSESAERRTDAGSEEGDRWRPPIVETVATDGEGVEELCAAFDAHRAYLGEPGQRRRRRNRHAEEIRVLLRQDLGDALAAALERAGGIDALAEAVRRGETDPYTVANTLLEPVESCLGELTVEGEE